MDNTLLIVVGIAAAIFAVFLVMAFRSMRIKPEEEDRFNISKKARRPVKKKKSTVAEDDALLDSVYAKHPDARPTIEKARKDGPVNLKPEQRKVLRELDKLSATKKKEDETFLESKGLPSTGDDIIDFAIGAVFLGGFF